MALMSCNSTGNNDSKLPIIGTWEYLTSTTIENGDSVHFEYSNSQKGIKIINATHFSFLIHDLSKGKDTTANFVSGGGRYDLSDNLYVEHLEYCSDREWENNDFKFTIDIQNDTLTQKGVEMVEGAKVDRVIIEKYVRVR